MLIRADRWPTDSFPRRATAWAVHLMTATGAVWGLLAILAVFSEHWIESFAWLAVAVLVDGIDGTFARWARVKEVLPHFDGALLDNLIDYQNYVIVPALFLYRAALLPAGWGIVAACSIALSSAYQFCHVEAKTPDHHFRGFPSYWNVVALYLFVFDWPQWTNLVAIGILAVLVFVPIKYVYPTRTKRLPRLTLILTALWGMAALAMLVTYPAVPQWLLIGSLAYVVYYLGLSFYNTWADSIRAPRPAL